MNEGAPMRSLTFLAFVLASCAVSFCQNSASSGAVTPAPPLEHFTPGQIDKSLDPCSDFFQYACNKWIKANPIPSDQAAWGTSSSLAIWNVAALRDTLEQAAAPTSNRTPVEQKAGDYYASCMDEATIDKLGIMPLQPVLDRIANLHDKSQLPGVIALIHQTIRPGDLVFTDAQYDGILFGIYAEADFDDASLNLAALDQSGMGMPGREFYLKDDEKSKQIREQYLKHVARILELSGETQSQAATDAQSVLTIETALANAAMDIVARRDPKNQNNKMTLQQVQALTPSFNWNQYLSAMHAPSSPQYLVLAPDFFRGMEKLVASEPVEHWRAYLKYSTVNAMASSLSQPFVDEKFEFYGKVLAGSEKIQPRWRRCSFNADYDLGHAVGQAYVAKYFPPENKERMLQMVAAIKAALNRDIDSATWMSDQTKHLAHLKLAAQIDKIGYPDHWRDYSSVDIKRGDFAGNVSRAARYEIE